MPFSADAWSPLSGRQVVVSSTWAALLDPELARQCTQLFAMPEPLTLHECWCSGGHQGFSCCGCSSSPGPETMPALHTDSLLIRKCQTKILEIRGDNIPHPKGTKEGRYGWRHLPSYSSHCHQKHFRVPYDDTMLSQFINSLLCWFQPCKLIVFTIISAILKQVTSQLHAACEKRACQIGKHLSLAKPKARCLEKMEAHVGYSLGDSGWLVRREWEVCLTFATLLNHQIHPLVQWDWGDGGLNETGSNLKNKKEMLFVSIVNLTGSSEG